MSTARKTLGMIGLLWTLFLFVLRRRDHGDVKAAFIHLTLGGQTRARVEQWTGQFVPDLLHNGLFKDALEAIAQHKREGARLVLMSASTDLYVPAIGTALGFDEVICTGVRWNGDKLDGRLSTPNRRGIEKAHCFEALQRAYPGLTTAAYGNTDSDLDHLHLADRPLLVNAPSSARRRAAQLGVPCARWD